MCVPDLNICKPLQFGLKLAMQRLTTEYSNTPEWIVVQPGRYRYVAFVDDTVVVRMVLSEYLACEVIWS